MSHNTLAFELLKELASDVCALRCRADELHGDLIDDPDFDDDSFQHDVVFILENIESVLDDLVGNSEGDE
jgi:hypothetical protein